MSVCVCRCVGVSACVGGCVSLRVHVGVCVCMYACTAGQKRAPDLFIDGCEPPCGCRELNTGPLEDEPML